MLFKFFEGHTENLFSKKFHPVHCCLSYVDFMNGTERNDSVHQSVGPVCVYSVWV